VLTLEYAGHFSCDLQEEKRIAAKAKAEAKMITFFMRLNVYVTKIEYSQKEQKKCCPQC
jgi:hypothetical protein